RGDQGRSRIRHEGSPRGWRPIGRRTQQGRGQRPGRCLEGRHRLTTTPQATGPPDHRQGGPEARVFGRYGQAVPKQTKVTKPAAQPVTTPRASEIPPQVTPPEFAVTDAVPSRVVGAA